MLKVNLNPPATLTPRHATRVAAGHFIQDSTEAPSHWQAQAPSHRDGHAQAVIIIVSHKLTLPGVRVPPQPEPTAGGGTVTVTGRAQKKHKFHNLRLPVTGDRDY